MSSQLGPPALSLMGAAAETWDRETWRERVRGSFGAVSASGPRVEEILATTTDLPMDITRPEQLERPLALCEGAPVIYFALPPKVTAKACEALGGRFRCRRGRRWCWRSRSR
jgi:glucose-6-phosphate 1-dehydrogenase